MDSFDKFYDADADGEDSEWYMSLPASFQVEGKKVQRQCVQQNHPTPDILYLYVFVCIYSCMYLYLFVFVFVFVCICICIFAYEHGSRCPYWEKVFRCGWMLDGCAPPFAWPLLSTLSFWSPDKYIYPTPDKYIHIQLVKVPFLLQTTEWNHMEPEVKQGSGAQLNF